MATHNASKAPRKATATALPANVLKSLKGKEADARQAVTDWRNKGKAVDAECAPSLVAAAVRIATAPHGEGMKEANKVGITETNEASRFAGAWKASLAYSARNGVTPSEAFPTFFVGSKNVSNGGMLEIARNASSLEGAADALKAWRAEAKKNRAPRVGNGNGSIQNGTKPSKASNGTTGNAHGGTGDTTAESNGDKGDKVSDTLASAVLSVLRRVSDAADAGTLDAATMKELAKFESIVSKARKAFVPVKATATK